MATVTQLAQRVCDVSGLDTDGADRANVLTYLNQAYEMSVLECGNYTSTFTASLTSGTGDYTFGTSPLTATDVMELRQMYVDSSELDNRPLVRVPEHQIQRLRQGDTGTATPLMYAVRGTRQLLLFPTPGSGVTLTGVYLAAPPTLVESGAAAGEETTPTAIPSPFHHDVIGNKALSLAMEFDNRFEEAAMYDGKWSEAMGRLLTWVGRFGGPTLGNADDLGFDGPRDMD